PENPNPEIPEDPSPEDPPVDPITPEESLTFLPIQIMELLPNPGTPKTDANDEFIELYNPHNELVDLAGYRLETGSEFNHVFTFGSRTIAAQTYMVLYAAETNLTLANSGGKARLLDPAGVVVSETAVYDAAKDNMSWTFTGSTWQWSTTP